MQHHFHSVGATTTTAAFRSSTKQRLQQLMLQQQAHIDSVSSRWVELEAKAIRVARTLVNSFLMSSGGQVRCFG